MHKVASPSSVLFGIISNRMHYHGFDNQSFCCHFVSSTLVGFSVAKSICVYVISDNCQLWYACDC